ncbi:leader peptidase (prepilin peptidase) / N-methyltransferase [Lachnospiraceae bacterium KH1T2]|nr:leader peptidase (prepilin peptidase) / N-methyltransferase [Lachnospiraceae bacterium KH1T2]
MQIAENKEMLGRLIMLLMLLICAATDIKNKRIYGRVLVIFLIAGLAAAWNSTITPLSSLLGAGIGCVMVLISAVTHEKIGFGDGLVLIVTGAVLGVFENLILLTAGSFLAAIVSMFVIFLKVGDRESELPFIPFLVVPELVILLGGLR